MLLKDVQHVPDVLLNLILAGRLDDEGYRGSIRNGVMKFSKGSLIVARAQKVNTLYLMNARLCPQEVNVASYTAGELWHKRLCHMNVMLGNMSLRMEPDGKCREPAHLRTGPDRF